MNVIDDIKERLHIEDVVARHVDLQRAGRHQRGLCPFHTEATPSFFVFEDSQRWKCFGCGKGGDVLDFLMLMEGWDLGEAIRETARMAGVTLRTLSPEEHRTVQRERDKQAIFAVAADFFHSRLTETAPDGSLSPGLLYAQSRGFDEATIKAAGLGYFGEDWALLRSAFTGRSIDLESPAAVAFVGYRGDVTAWAKAQGISASRHWVEANKVPAMPPGMLMYPHVLRGRVVYISGRKLVTEEHRPKSWNPPLDLVGPKQPFFNHQWGKRSEECHYQMAVVVEGQACAISLGQWGIPAVAKAGAA
jgi:DNA primase